MNSISTRRSFLSRAFASLCFSALLASSIVLAPAAESGDKSDSSTPRLTVSPTGKFRQKDGRVEQLAYVQTTLPLSGAPSEVVLRMGTLEEVSLGAWDGREKKECWIPVADRTTELEVSSDPASATGKSILARGSLPATLLPYFVQGTMSIVPASHNDIAILFTDDKTFEHRDKAQITPALDLMKTNKDYCFSMECTLYLMDYLRRRPERKAEMAARIKEGRFEWGGTYNQPIESLFAGESLARQVYFGRKWFKKTFPGCDTRIAMNADVPQRALQMSQILHKAGIKYLTLWRGFNEGYFHMASPDGSSVLAIDYENFYKRILGNVHKASYFSTIESNLTPELLAWGKTYEENGFPAEFPIVDWFDYQPPHVYDDIIKARNEVARRLVESSPGWQILFPPIRYANFTMILDQVVQAKPNLKTYTGSRQCPWYYDQGPGHHWAISAGREAVVLLTAAEKFATVEALLSGDLRRYPAQELSDAWEAQIYTDHGWGGYQFDQDLHDMYFQAKLEYARDTGRKVLERVLASIAAKVKPRKDRGQPIVVFNALSWERTDPVTCTVDALKMGATSFRIVDAEGREAPYQVIPVEVVPGARATASTVTFIATDVPPIGYKTYYVVPSDTLVPALPADSKLENPFYRIELSPGGVKSIFDKQLKRELLNTGKFLGGEVFTMHSAGTGPFGDMGGYHLPTMEGFEKLSQHAPQWVLEENGPVYTTYRLLHPPKSHEQLQTPLRCFIEQKVVLYRAMKRIDFNTSLLGWDGTRQREYRMAFPLNLEKASISYEVPFGIDEVGKTEAKGSEDPAYARCDQNEPRIVQDWMGASDDALSVVISSSVSVFGFTDPTTNAIPQPMLQPLLLATRSMGKVYAQAGNHHYQFSLTSCPPGQAHGFRFGNQINNSLIAVVVTHPQETGVLPELKSFCSVDVPNVIISTIKKCEDDDHVVIRCYDIAGKDSLAHIRFAFPLAAAEVTNMIEEEGQPIPSEKDSVSVPVGHHAIETIKLRMAY